MSLKHVRVLIPMPQLFPLDYLLPNNLDVAIGDLVIVPFRHKEYLGIVWQTNILSNLDNLKYVKCKLEWKIDLGTINFINKLAEYYIHSLGSCAKLLLPVDILEKPIKSLNQELPKSFNLSPLSKDQKSALDAINETKKPTIIKGVTGSGKTEVYFHLVSEYLEKDQQVLILLPEIALSHQVIQRFVERFSFEPAIWNANITKAKKKKILRGIINNEVKIVIGARSSLFLPYNKLGLIVIDEEHDNSYKQEEGILYNARDMGVLRGALCSAKVVLCSATPSIETLYNVISGKYHMVTLASRYQKASMPDVQIIDMKTGKTGNNLWLSKSLINAITTNLDKKEQTLLFLNRRGYAPLMLCNSCGHRCSCPACSAWLVVHSGTKRLECHHCGYQSKIHASCPECSSDDSLVIYGSGVERIAEETRSIFPSAKIALISKDHIKKAEDMQQLLLKMQNNEIDILIGTQIITKGYHFPNLTLVGVIDADCNAVAGDLRASEKMYQLLHQVGGRAGREELLGRVLLQTYYPENIVLQSLKNQLESEFIEHEINSRQHNNMPPYTKMAAIIISSKNDMSAKAVAQSLAQKSPTSEARILGPAKALMHKLVGRYRYRILVIADKKFNIQKYLSFWLSHVKIPNNVQVKLDIDPQNFF